MSGRRPREENADDLFDGDFAEVDPSWRQAAILRLAREPEPGYRGVLETALWDQNPRTAFIAYLGLRRLHPPVSGMHEAWLDLFGESVRLLETRAASGPLPLRIAAMQALAFAPGGVFTGVIERWKRDPLSELTTWGSLTEQPPALPVINDSGSGGWPEIQGVLLAATADRGERVRLMTDLLETARGDDALPVFLALQLEPEPEMTDMLLPWLHAPDTRIAVEAARAVLACGGSGVYVLLLAQVKQAGDPDKRSGFLSVLARTGREEAWQVCCAHLNHEDAAVRLAAVEALARFPRPATDRQQALRERQNDPHGVVAATAHGWLWRLGALESVSRLTQMLSDASAGMRQAAARALALVAPATAVPLLVDLLEVERQGDVLRAALISLRRLLPGRSLPPRVLERLLLQFRRLLSGPDFFRRSQVAVLCGFLGTAAEELLLSSLEEQEHPHVLASLLAAVARVGSTRVLVFSRFRDHPDPRVRANLMEALLGGGPGGIPFLSQGLRDPSPRVRSGAARSLFALGQLEVVGVLNRMLLTPSPLPVLAACHALGSLMRWHPPALSPDHPLRLQLGTRVRRRQPAAPGTPAWLSEPFLPELLQELA
ncbi:MAG TPA: HEAT repeat domain-containing protein, partial [Candidatus Ozemobacteraceae bacterium]|nr:HEAT repeat domain-containing protein [Candidatus Ozemobacteraceae bacterium]